VTDLNITALLQREGAVIEGLPAPLPLNITAALLVPSGSYDIGTTRTRIGREPSNEIVLKDDTFCSRNHAFISYEDGEFWLEDLGSTNGTLLNGHPVTKRLVLTSGDKIRVGHTELIFEVKRTACS
jgi:pSer/pThr/pTyr-binding forkhead associated (FHA) protein